MQRALDSAIGLPRRSMSASWILVFLMPAEGRRYFMMPLLADFMGAERLLSSLALRLKQNYPRTEPLHSPAHAAPSPPHPPPPPRRRGARGSPARPAARRDHCEIGRPLLRKPSAFPLFGQP